MTLSSLLIFIEYAASEPQLSSFRSLLADMAGVEQLAGLVARLEAVAVKLESSGGAGGAGGDAGASVQVQKQVRLQLHPIICSL